MSKFTKEQEFQICEEYFSGKNLSTMKLSKKWGCGDFTISNILRRNGYVLRTKRLFTKKEEKQICKEYFSKEKPSTYVLAKKWNCDYGTINNILKRNGYTLRTNSESHKGKNKIFIKNQGQQICKEYFSKEKLSLATLAKKWNCSTTTIVNVIMKNGYVIRTMKEVKSSPEAIQRILKNGYGKKCYYNNEFFPSLQERDCYIYLIKLGYKVIHNFLGRFDFLVTLTNNKKVVVEFHPCSWFFEKRDYSQYYKDRRKLLDKYRYKNLKLVVIKNLKEIENKLIKGV